MNIGIIGAGNLGTALGIRFAERGHSVSISFARSIEKIEQAASTVGHGAVATTVSNAVTNADVVVLATPWAATLDVLREHAEALAGKIVWDTTNPLLPDMSGLAVGTTSSGGEAVASVVPAAIVVKALAPFAAFLASGTADISGERTASFVCSDDVTARTTVVKLLREIGVDAIEAGPLRNARYTEPLGMLLVQLAYVEGMGPQIGTRLLRR